MKKIEKKVGKIIIFCVILLILFASLLVFREYKKYKEAHFIYNGFEVQKLKDNLGEFYRITVFVNKNHVPSYVTPRNNPKELDDIPMNIKKASLLNKTQIYITLDPYANLTSKATVAALEINNFIDNEFLFNIPVNSAFTKSWKNQTVKTCNDVTSTTGIIILQLGTETKVYEDNCIIVQGKTEEDLVKAADRLSLTLLGVIKP